MRGKARILLNCFEGDTCDMVDRIESQLKASQEINKQRGIPPDIALIKEILRHIYIILKENYYPDFFMKIMKIPTTIYKQQTCITGLNFNSLGKDLDIAKMRQLAKQYKYSSSVVSDNDPPQKPILQKTNSRHKQNFNLAEYILLKQ